MRNILGKLFAIIATIVLLFSAAFFTVSLILRDNDKIEKKYQELKVGEDMHMSTPDLSKATTALLDYMRGERANIKVGAIVDGEYREDLFWHEKEIVHMAEVQELWVRLDWFARYGAMGAGILLLFGFFLMQHGKRRALLSSAMIWGCGIFGGILAFMGLWAVLDFDSFWTVFHFIIFPQSLFQYLSAGATVEAMNELNWVMEPDSIMINMLMPIFPSLVLRCAICVFLEIGVTALIAIFVHFAWRKQGKPSPVADIVVVEHDANEPRPIKGPDLVLAHKLQNAPVSKREEILRRAENGEPLDGPIPAEEDGVPENGEHLISRLSATASPQGEASDAADQKPSPQGEDVERSETDEVSVPASEKPCIPPSDEGGRSERSLCEEERGEARLKQEAEEVDTTRSDHVSGFDVSRRLTEGERTTPQSADADSSPDKGSSRSAEASDTPEEHA